MVHSIEETSFQPPSIVFITIIITQLHVTIHYRPLCAASMYCGYLSVQADRRGA